MGSRDFATAASCCAPSWTPSRASKLSWLRDELVDITRLAEATNPSSKRIGDRDRRVAPCLLAMPGCGTLTTATDHRPPTTDHRPPTTKTDTSLANRQTA
jgi:hypothetical protein